MYHTAFPTCSDEKMSFYFLSTTKNFENQLFLFRLLLIRSTLPGKKLLLHCSRVECLGRCRCLLGGYQGLSQLCNLPVFYFKLPLQRVDSCL